MSEVLDYGALSVLVIGFLLGLKHATDADHVVAVSTIVSEYRNAWRGIWIGASWGLGHTTPLILLGTVILVFKEAALDRYESVAHVFEFGVGIMMCLLGLQVFWNLKKGSLHAHAHDHGDSEHVHIHASHKADDDDHAEESSSGLFNPGRPFFRVKSYAIGVVHGLAGSAAVMLVLLPKISTFWLGMGYLALFGIGTIFSMAVVTLVLGVPFATGKRLRFVNEIVAGLAGTASFFFGAALMVGIWTGTNWVSF